MIFFPADDSETIDSDGDGFGDNSDPFPNDPTNLGDAAWAYCSNEFGVCTPPVPALVRYGLDDVYFYQQVNDSIDCKNAAFGNPINVRKRCDYLLSDTADFDNDGVVDKVDAFPADGSETIDSDADGFGDNSDPFPNDSSNANNENWAYCSNEFGVCTPPVPALVRYGLDDVYFYQQVNDSIDCKNSAFGNPINVRKRCDYLLSDYHDHDGDGVFDSADIFPNNAYEWLDSDYDGIGDNSDPFPNDSDNAKNGNWAFCSKEFGICRLPLKTIVRYGADGEYAYAEKEDNVYCNNATFGNPINVRKNCHYFLDEESDSDGDGVADIIDLFPDDPKNHIDTDGDGVGDHSDQYPNDANNNIQSSQWVYCSDEWDTCDVPVPAMIRYGANDTYFYQYATDTLSCTNFVFGDPIGNMRKHCEYLLSDTKDYDQDGLVDSVDPYPSDPHNISSLEWQHCANSDELCQVENKSLVRYGAQDNYRFKIIENSITCNNTNFDEDQDPIEGVEKACEFISLAPVVTNEKKFGWFDVGVTGSALTSSVNAEIIIGHNNVPYVLHAEAGSSEKLIIKRFNGTFWEAIDNDNLITLAKDAALAVDNNNTPYVFYVESTPRESSAIVKKFNGISWEVVGTESIEMNIISEPSIIFDTNNVPYIAYKDNINAANAVVKKFNGTNWDQVGSEVPSQGHVYGLGIAIDSNDTVYIAYRDVENSFKSVVKKFNGSGWSFVGGQPLSQGLSSGLGLRIDKNNVPYVFYQDNEYGNQYFVKRFNDESWEEIGMQGFPTYSWGGFEISRNNDLYVGKRGSGSTGLAKFNGLAWSNLTEQGFSNDFSLNFSMTLDNNDIPYVAFNSLKESTQNREVKVKRFYDGDSIYHNIYSQKEENIIINAKDIYNSSLINYSLANTHDASFFSINHTKGVITLNAPLNIENPQDSNKDNIYTFDIEMMSERGGVSYQTIHISLLRNYGPIITAPPLSTANESIMIDVHGQPMSQVYINGENTGHNLEAGGVANIALDMSGDDGDKYFSIALVFPSGEESEPFEFSILKDTLAPNAPTFSSIPESTNEDSISIRILGEVESYPLINGLTKGPLWGNGSTPVVLDTSGEDGEKVFSAQLIDPTGNESEAVIFSIQKDTVPPNAPTITEVPLQTNSNMTTIKVNGEVGATVLVNGVITGSKINTNGLVSINLDTSGQDGEKTFSIALQDSATNESNPFNISITKDATPPGSPELSVIPATTSDSTIAVEIKGEVGSEIFVNGISTDKVIGSNGTIIFELDASAQDGEKTFVITLQDQLGNQSEDIHLSITPPNFPVLSTTPTETDQDAVVVEVNGEIDSTVFVNGNESSEPIDSSGKATITLDTSGGLGDKVFHITLRNNAGNISDPLIITINKYSIPVITNETKSGWVEITSNSALTIERNIGSASTALDNNNMLYVVYEDSADHIVVKRFNGNFWKQLGSKLPTNSGNSAIAIDKNNTPYIFYYQSNSYIGGNVAMVKRFNGSDWETVGNEGFSQGVPTYFSILFDNNNVPYIAYADIGLSYKAVVKKLTGTTWEAVGVEGFSQEGIHYTLSVDIDSNNRLYAAYRDTANDFRVAVKYFNGISWEDLGEQGISQGFAADLSIRIGSNNKPYLLYRDNARNYRTFIKEYSGSDWQDLAGFPFHTINNTLLFDSNGVPVITYSAANKADLQIFNGVFWNNLSKDGFSKDTPLNVAFYLDSKNIPYVTYHDFGLDVMHFKKLYDGSINHNVFDQQTLVIDVDATDIYGESLRYSLLESYDSSLFSINENTGVVNFKTSPDIDNPQDSNVDNIYTFEVKVQNHISREVIQKVNITVVRNDKPTLTTTPISTAENTVSVEVNGNKAGEKVFLNGLDTGLILSDAKKATITLDTSGEEGYKHFDIKLKQDDNDYFSNSLFLNIYKDNSAPEVLSGWPATGQRIALNHNNQIEVIYSFIDSGGISTIKIYDGEGNDISADAIIDSNSITLQLTPEQDRSYEFTIIATDNNGYERKEQLSFTVSTYSPTTIASLPSGVYNQAISVDLVSAKNATIYYSTDGYPPIIGAANTQQGNTQITNIAISSTTNLQYFAVDAAGNREATKSNIYYFGELEAYNPVISADYDVQNQQITLTWDSSNNAQAYKVYRVHSPLDVEVLTASQVQQYLAPAAYLLATFSTNHFTDTTIENGASYYYAISKVDGNGIESLISDAVNINAIPLTNAAAVDDAIKRTKNWLYRIQNNNGTWGSNKNLALLNTTAALDALQHVKDKNSYGINKALGYVLGAYADNNDYLSRQILTLSNYSLYTDDKVNKLLSQSNFNENIIYGWGLLKRYRRNAFDTALAYKATQTSAREVSKYVGVEQVLLNGSLVNSQGRWSWVNQELDSIYVSALVYQVTQSTRENYAWIEQSQHLDGSFGNGLLDTIGVVLYLELSKKQRDLALAYIIAQQNPAGDFNNDIYLSALALQVLSQGVK